MKRFIALFLCVILLVFSVGCGKNEPVNSDEPSTTEGNIFDNPFDEDSTTTTTTTQTETTTKKAETTTKKETTTKEPVDTGIKSIKTKDYETSSATQTVYYPDNIDVVSKPYPVISWANGTMVTSGFYDKLLVEIAKGGYIVVACDESMSADGTAQIASIDFILSKNNDKNDIFYNKIDTNRIGVIGHSQGGRSSVNAAQTDSRIDCVVSIAGSNFDYEVEGLKTPTLFFAGTSDMIVSPKQWIEPAYDIAKGPAVYASLNGGIHTTCSTNPEKYSSYIIDWLDGWLKNDKSALNTFKDGGKLSKDNSWVDFKCKNI
ncbi:MAG: dienelactone hydrolase family protein [Clostridia bacterium]|nr:dienelactone hydrolase family protein [Clostridia bacterium]